MSHAKVAQAVRERKERRPEDYCADARCLYRRPREAGEDWRCPKHGLPAGRPVGAPSAT